MGAKTKETDSPEKVKDIKMKKDKKERKDKKETKEKKEEKSRKRKQEVIIPESGSISSKTGDSDKLPSKKKAKFLQGLEEKVNGEAEDAYNKKILLKGAKKIEEFEGTLTAESIKNLANRGITSLFEIQVKTMPSILAGKDVIGRARTGMGKTLAFALPVIEQLITKKEFSRFPVVIVLAPTRELAKQVASEFELTGPSLKVLPVYGGASINDQTYALRNGVDVVVGTPGRVLDHINRGTLNLSNIKHLILDEADQMLDMGFKEEMDSIFEGIFSSTNSTATNKKFQVLLFSATLPGWVNQVAREKMTDPERIDLVGDFESASKDVTHLCIQCPWQNENRASLISDLVKMYAGSKAGRAIVFCNTKKQCNELEEEKRLARMSKVIHGDVTQAQRESTLEGFRSGMFKILIATDVAARGLDIKNVDLVVNCEPPCKNQNFKTSTAPPKADVDTYVHRSGRTGRAGKKGVCVTLFTPKQVPIIQEIERKTSNSLQRIGRPQTDDLLLGAARATVEDLLSIPKKVYSKFDHIAEEMVDIYGPERAISMCLAKLTGFEDEQSMNKRSLLGGEEGYVTVKYENMSKRPGDIRLGYVWTMLRSVFSNKVNIVEQAKGMALLASELGAVFDLPQEAAEELRARIERNDRDVEGFEICVDLPEVKAKEFAFENNNRSRGNSSFGGNGFRGRGGFGGRGRGGFRR